MALIQSTAIPSGATDYELEQSLRFEDTARNGTGSYLSRKPPLEGNRKRWTYSCWAKGLPAPNTNSHETQVLLGVDGGTNHYLWLSISNDGTFDFRQWDNGSGYYWRKISTALFRDPSAWYHFIVVYDSANGTAEDRIKMYVNGERITSFGTNLNPSQNLNSFVNDDDKFHSIGRFSMSGVVQEDGALNGYLAEVNFIDGLVKTPADFGETGTYGEWKPVEYSGSYGTNGFYLPFKQDYTVEGFSTVIWKNDAPMYVGGVGFKADLVWAKSRLNAQNSAISDAITGFDRYGSSQLSNAFYSGLTSIAPTTDGFTSNTDWFSNGHSYVAWNWDMGGSNATNNNGGTTSTVRANPTYGQSIVSYTTSTANSGLNTLGHGLSSAPEMIIYKVRDTARDWTVYHVGTDDSPKKLELNNTDAKGSGGDFDNTAPTATVFTDWLTTGGKSTIAYCFHSVTGYSKFGSYTGGGGTPVTTTLGFAPAFVMVKNTTSAANWEMFDNVRNPTAPQNLKLGANLNVAENGSDLGNLTQNNLEFLSNGFKTTGNYTDTNQSGSNFIYMAFADTREYAYWLDQSGNNNDWTSNNLTESDVMVDSPTNNFATIDPLSSGNGAGVISEGNLKYKTTAKTGVGTQGISSGKAYAEVTLSSASNQYIGVCDISRGINPLRGGGWSDHGGIAYKFNGDQYKLAVGSNTSASASYGASYTNGDIIGIAIDVDNDTITFYKNGVSQGNTASGPSFLSSGGVYSIMVYGGSDMIFTVNFGQDSSFAGAKTAQGNQDANGIGDFYYAPPSGYLALCTKNLPNVDVTPSENFDTVLYTGNQGTNLAITGVGFEPSLVWGKNRSSSSNHWLFDAVRGTTKMIQSDQTSTEETQSGVTAFGSDGFTLGNWIGSTKTNDSYVAWNWKANGSGSSNTAGSINSTVSANVDAGFSIVSYTGNGAGSATVGHGLSAAPEMIFIKGRSAASGWRVYHTSLSSGKVLKLESTGAEVTDDSFGTHTATNIALGSNGSVIDNNVTFIAYCFHSVDGYSAVGSYIGNSNADGTFIYTGFRPAFILVKSSTEVRNWHNMDSTRNPNNPANHVLWANRSNAEYSDNAYTDVDFLSNGFKLRNNDTAMNNNGQTHIYIAFAETPFKYSNAR
tara:strand:- start:275 stop:3676 length:3402 start_codon:yes stop_codon:yes gene_type:complete